MVTYTGLWEELWTREEVCLTIRDEFPSIWEKFLSMTSIVNGDPVKQILCINNVKNRGYKFMSLWSDSVSGITGIFCACSKSGVSGIT